MLEPLQLCHFESFLNIFSKPLVAFSKILKDKHRDDVSVLLSGREDIYSYPIIIPPNGGYICAIPELIIYAVTNGLYYRLVTKNGFSEFYGDAFENHIGRIAEKYLGNDRFYSGNISDGKHKKSDWIKFGDGYVLSIECKTKKISETGLKDNDVLASDILMMCKGIAQNYKAIKVLQDGKYGKIKYNNEIPVSIIVGLEEIFGDLLREGTEVSFKEILKKKLDEEGIDLEDLKKYPVLMLSERDFRNMVQIVEQKGIRAFFQPLLEPNIHLYFGINEYIGKQFSDMKFTSFPLDDDVLEELLQNILGNPKNEPNL